MKNQEEFYIEFGKIFTLRTEEIIIAIEEMFKNKKYKDNEYTGLMKDIIQGYNARSKISFNQRKVLVHSLVSFNNRESDSESKNNYAPDDVPF